jgi:hypothetical protein
MANSRLDPNCVHYIEIILTMMYEFPREFESAFLQYTRDIPEVKIHQRDVARWLEDYNDDREKYDDGTEKAPE